MMFLLMLIIPDRDDLEDLLISLHSAGAVTITTINSEEYLPNNDDQPLQEDFPIIPSFKSITDLSQSPSKIVIAFAPTKETLKNLVTAVNTYLKESEITQESSLSIFPVGDISTILND